MYEITCQISSSVMPTPCCVAPFCGMAVPGTPSLIVRKRSASVLPCFFCARVRSGPRPPPRAPSPWQKAQLARNSNSPSFAELGSFDSGFVSCARISIAAMTKSTAAQIVTRPREPREKKIPIIPPGGQCTENFPELYHLPEEGCASETKRLLRHFLH